jgi:hypothetical protein
LDVDTIKQCIYSTVGKRINDYPNFRKLIGILDPIGHIDKHLGSMSSACRNIGEAIDGFVFHAKKIQVFLEELGEFEESVARTQACAENAQKQRAVLSDMETSVREVLSRLRTPFNGLFSSMKSRLTDEGAESVMGKKRDAELSRLSAATLRDDVEELKRLIGGKNPATFQYDRNDLPNEILTVSPARLSLLDIAAGCGSERAFSMLHLFFGMNPTWATFATAIVNGQCSMVRSVWDRLSGKGDAVSELCRCGKSAAEFHRTDILIWLIGQPEALSAQRRTGGSSVENVVKYVAKEAVRLRLAPTVIALSREGVVDFSDIEYRKWAAKCGWVAFLNIFLPLTVSDWIELSLSSGGQIRVISWLKQHAPAGESDFVDAALKGDLERGRALLGVLVGRVERNEPVDPAWRVLFERYRVHRDLQSGAEARAWLTLGFDVNMIEPGQPPLIRWYVERRQPEVIATLAAAGADVNGEGTGWYPSLIYAALQGLVNEMETLLACGANVNVNVCGSGRSALRVAFDNKRDDAVDRLLAAGADPLTAFESETAAENWRRVHAAKEKG